MQNFPNPGKQTSRFRKPREFHYERRGIQKRGIQRDPLWENLQLNRQNLKTRTDSKSAKGKRFVMYKGILIKLLTDFSPETFQARRKWCIIVKRLKETCQLSILYLAKMSFKGETKSFQTSKHWNSSSPLDWPSKGAKETLSSWNKDAE